MQLARGARDRLFPDGTDGGRVRVAYVAVQTAVWRLQACVFIYMRLVGG